MKNIPINLFLAVLVSSLLLCIWEWGVQNWHVPRYILPAPSLILRTLSDNAALYTQASLFTFSEAALGLLIGASLGFLTASLIQFFPRLEEGAMTVAILIKSTPMVAIAPLLTIWLGFGILPKIIITALLTFFPVLVNALSGFHALDEGLLNTFRSWNASRSEIFWYMRLPSALPYLFAALKVSAPLALIGAVVAEWTGASGGLGRTMWLAYSNLNLPYLFAAVFILAVAGMLVYSSLNWLERRVIFWRGESW